MEPRDRRPDRPFPGDRGGRSQGPISRVSSRPGPPPAARPAAAPTAPAVGRPGSPASHGTYRPVGPGGRSGVPPTRSFVPPRTGFGLPNLRRNVCPHFYMTGTRGAIPIQAPHLLKGLLRQPTTISRCQLRGGVHLEEGFVNDVCLTPRFNQCVFYEEKLTQE